MHRCTATVIKYDRKEMVVLSDFSRRGEKNGIYYLLQALALASLYLLAILSLIFILFRL